MMGFLKQNNMNYYIDTEFLEGPQNKWFGRKTKPTIDLISIGIVSEDNREYYAISKDFNLKEAWNRYDLNHGSGDQKNHPPKKIYWIRENVLKPIWIQLQQRSAKDWAITETFGSFSYKSMKRLIEIYGQSNTQIAKGIKSFTFQEAHEVKSPYKAPDINFYAYYADYDWVALCWLFGKMIDLPKGFPMYCRDLKQMMDEKVSNFTITKSTSPNNHVNIKGSEDMVTALNLFKGNPDFPKQTNEHSAIDDAKWNKALHEYIQL